MKNLFILLLIWAVVSPYRNEFAASLEIPNIPREEITKSTLVLNPSAEKINDATAHDKIPSRRTTITIRMKRDYIETKQKLTTWLLQPEDDEPFKIFSLGDILEYSRTLFRFVGPTCYDHSNPLIVHSTLILGDTVTKLLLHLSLETATRILQLYIAVSECLPSPIEDDTPLINFAIFPKTYQPTIRKMPNFEIYRAMELFFKLVQNDGNGGEMDLCLELMPSRVLEGRRWDALHELSAYNLALLQYYNEDREGARDTLERIIYGSKVHISDDMLPQRDKNQNEEDSSLSNATIPLLVLTCASENKLELYHLLELSGNVNLQKDADTSNFLSVEVLGMGRSFPGTFAKVKMLQERVSTLPPHQLVLFLDAYDTLLFPSITNIVQVYQKGGMTNGIFKEIVFGAERGPVPYPDPAVGQLYDADSFSSFSSFKYLNSGTILGSAGALTEMTLEVTSYPSILASDQRGYTRYYLTHPNQVGLDTEGRGFFTLFGVFETSYIDLTYGYFKNDAHTPIESLERIPIRPFVVHGNGGPRGGKEYYWNLCSVLRHVQYEQQTSEGNEKENWVPISPPIFTLAFLAENGEMDVDEVISAFRNHVKQNVMDVRALVYLASKLANDEKTLEEAQKYLDLAVAADRNFVEKVLGDAVVS